MSACKSLRKRKTEGHSRLRSLFKTRGPRIAGLVIFVISAIYLSYQTSKVIAALNVWTDLRAADPYSDGVRGALRSLNDEEIALIAPFGLTLLAFFAAVHSVELKIIPRKCFYCRKWAQAKNVKQTPDRAFYYHQECEAKKRKQDKDS